MLETQISKNQLRKIYLEAYGCTLSKSEAGIYVNSLLREGDTIVSDPSEADLRVINTCVVISQTENRMIRRIQELSDFGDVEVTGCLPAVSAQSLDQPGIKLISAGTFRNFYRGAFDNVEIRDISIFDGIPINQGCTGNCNFCISRIARGKLLSRAREKIVGQVKLQLARGIKEVRITSLDTAAYGRDIGTRLPDLIGDITAINGDFQLRIGMMEPKNTSEILQDLLYSYSDSKVYKFMHLPVQSGSDFVLEKMNRGYSSSDFLRIASSFRERFPEGMLSTDIITGYPGEGNAEFEETIEVIEKSRPNIVNVTRFSPRPYTRDFSSAPMSSNETKKRDKAIMEIHRRISWEEFSKSVGNELSVLITEHGKGETMVGRDQNYRPVVIPGRYDLYSRVNCEIVGYGETYLIAKESDS